MRRPAFNVGDEVWWIDWRLLWYRCRITRREKTMVTLEPVTGADALHREPWVLGKSLTFSLGSQAGRRVRHISEAPRAGLQLQ